MPRSPSVKLKDLPPEQRERARKLKRKAEAEARKRIRQHFQRAGLPRPKTEHRFHPKRRWRMDVAWPSRKVYLEVEGGVWTQGRHTRGAGFLADIEKHNAAATMGWRLLRCTPEQLYEPETLALVREALS